MNFNKIVKEIFSSFFIPLRFTLKSESKGFIEYEHEHKVLVISLTYDYNRSFEVDVNFYLKINNEFYTLVELREYFNKEKNQFRATQIMEDDKLRIWVYEVKSFLDNNLEELIKNRIMISSELDRIRSHNVNDYSDRLEAKFLKNDVDKFWNDKNYVELVECVKKHKGNIDGVLKKKYEYALKKVE
jgi:hypothetical protein